MRKPITSFEELAEHQAKEALNNRQAFLTAGGDIHEVDRADTDTIELGGRVADELK